MLVPSVAGSVSSFVVVRPWLATIVRIKCRGSKSDKFNTGNVKWLTVAAEDCLCPVELFCEYWDATEALGFEDDLPLFRHYDGKLVTSRQVVAAIKRQAEVMGLDPRHFAGHSLRIGGGTAMTAADFLGDKKTAKFFLP